MLRVVKEILDTLEDRLEPLRRGVNRLVGLPALRGPTLYVTAPLTAYIALFSHSSSGDAAEYSLVIINCLALSIKSFLVYYCNKSWYLQQYQLFIHHNEATLHPEQNGPADTRPYISVDTFMCGISLLTLACLVRGGVAFHTGYILFLTFDSAILALAINKASQGVVVHRASSPVTHERINRWILINTMSSLAAVSFISLANLFAINDFVVCCVCSLIWLLNAIIDCIVSRQVFLGLLMEKR